MINTTTVPESTQPILRIEVGQHTAVIRSLDVDRSGKFFVTCSDDKTARVWGLPEGRLRQVLRPPVGAGANEGKLNAVAISPDSRVVAVGGSDVGAAETGCSVYIFDPESGKVLNRLEPVESTIIHLAFSRDGAFLAATLYWGGIRVWDTRTWRLVATDRSYGERSYCCTFDQLGRLASTCCDGFIRLYEWRENAYCSSYARKMPESQLNAISFSPDGQRLVVSYHNMNAISVISATDLSHLLTPVTPSHYAGLLSTVCWSAEGRFLYAGGSCSDQSGVRMVLKWDEGGGGQCTALPAARDTVMDLKPWGANGVLFAAADPRFGGFADSGKKVFERITETVDMRGKLAIAFSVSLDGQSLRFGLRRGDLEPVRFDLSLRRLTTEAPVDQTLTPPRLVSNNLILHGWEHTGEPTVNGIPLPLDKYEDAHSVAIAPDGKRFLIGAEWSLRLFDSSGAQVWKRDSSDVIWGVNIPGGGKVAIAACADGTIRWCRLEDGEELLALFVHTDGQRWIAWTPQGYYDSSGDADGLIGWHLNRGRDEAAEFFPAWQFRQHFYRPDVVSRVLDTLDVFQAIRHADAAAKQPTVVMDARELLGKSPPPTIEVLTPHTGATFTQPELRFLYLLRHLADISHIPKCEMHLLIDGRPQEIASTYLQTVNTAAIFEVTVWLPPRDVTVALEAHEGDFAVRSPELKLHWGGTQARPNLYVLAVGVSEYQSYSPLRFAHCDANEFAKALRGQKRGKVYVDVQVRKRVNNEATRAEIMGGLQWLTDNASWSDVAVIFLSGHALTDRQGTYYFLPHDFDPYNFLGTSVPQQELTACLAKVSAGIRIVLVDSCHAGAALNANALGTAQSGQFRTHVDIDGLANELRHTTGVMVFASTTGTEDSFEDAKWQHGAFTKALLDGLAGRADYEKNGVITIDELVLYVSSRVKQMTGGKQVPQRLIMGSDFPIAQV